MKSDQAHSQPHSLDPQVWRVLGVVFLAPFMAQMDSTVVNVSLSTIRQDLNASLESTQWVISGYLLALALMLPLTGWLVDRFGAKKLYLFCFSAFTLASVLCGSAHSLNALIVARLLQGMAGGLLVPMTGLMLARVAGKQMARVMGYAAVPVLLAPLIGPIVAGAILKIASWPWLFYINLPIGILAVILAVFLLPADHDSAQKRNFDFLGFLLLSPGLACFLYGLEQSLHQGGLWFLLIGIFLVGCFIARAIQKRSSALIDLDLFKNSPFLASVQSQFWANGLMYAGQFLVPLYLTMGCGFTPAKTGWLLVPMGLGMMVSYPLIGRMTERFGFREVATGGAILSFLGTLPFLWLVQDHFSPLILGVCLLARGIGQGAIGLPSSSAAYVSVPRDKLSTATTTINIIQRLGGPVATTLVGITVSLTVNSNPGQQSQSFLGSFILLNFLQALVFLFTLKMPSKIHD